MPTKIQFYPLDISYKLENDSTKIYLYGRTIDNKQIAVVDKDFHPYFYAVLKDEKNIDNFCEKIKKIHVENNDRLAEAAKTEVVDKKIVGKKIKAVRIFTKIPSDVPVLRSTIKEWDMVENTYEYDIGFTKRYLIDKKITPLILVEAEGDYITEKNKVPVFEAVKIKQKNTDSIQKPKILAFDIETYNPTGKRFIPEEHPIIMIAFYSDDFRKVITWKRFKTDLDYIEFVDGEVDLINRFKEIIEHVKPDIITGYFSDGFDFPYIITRAKKYKITLDIGLDHSIVQYKKGKTDSIKLTGIIHLDVFKFISKILGRSLNTDSFSLNDVAYEILGQEKDDVDIENLSESWDQGKDNLEDFCRYNLKDAELTYFLCIKVLPNIEELVKIIGIPIAEIIRMSFSQLVEWFIIKQEQDFKEIAPNRPNYHQISERRAYSYEGAFVYEPKPGLYKDIVVFDFRSLYPSIITSHNIGPSTLNCRCCKMDPEYAPTDKKEYWFCKKHKGFLPTILEDIITRRMRIKEMLKEKKEAMLIARSDSLKLLANSFYGYLGFFGARWYCFECARSVTAYGRYYIQKVIQKAKDTGFEVLYSDTDSIFLTLKDKTKEDALKFVDNINENLPGLMELEYEGHYPSGIFVGAKAGPYGAKKKYALLDEKGLIKIKGFETIRRNWSIIAKEVQQELLNIILKENDIEKALKFVRQKITDLKDKKIANEKVVISTVLQKDTSDYSSVGPHVAVANRLKAQGVDIGKGSVIKFIITEGKGIIRDKAKFPEEVEEGKYDADYYINHQIIPSVEQIFAVLGYDKEDLLQEGKQSGLGEFF